jgi:hypothetical protein
MQKYLLVFCFLIFGPIIYGQSNAIYEIDLELNHEDQSLLIKQKKKKFNLQIIQSMALINYFLKIGQNHTETIKQNLQKEFLMNTHDLLHFQKKDKKATQQSMSLIQKT